MLKAIKAAAKEGAGSRSRPSVSLTSAQLNAMRTAATNGAKLSKAQLKQVGDACAASIKKSSPVPPAPTPTSSGSSIAQFVADAKKLGYTTGLEEVKDLCEKRVTDATKQAEANAKRMFQMFKMVAQPERYGGFGSEHPDDEEDALEQRDRSRGRKRRRV